MEKYLSNIMKLNLRAYLISYALTTIAMSLPHAVLTIVLFQKGLSLSEIMLVQTTYSAAVLLFEYPSGLLADLYSKKKLYVISRVLLLAMMLVVVFTSGLFWMCFAWFLYGIGNALDSGTLDADIINSLKQTDQTNRLSKFISVSNQLDFVSLLVGSTIGSWIYYKIGVNFYFVGIILVILAIITIVPGYKEGITNSVTSGKPSIVSEIVSGLNEIKKSKGLKIMIALTFSSQFFFQAHYQLWQGLFLNKGLDKKNFYIVYIVFQLISLAAYNINFDKNKSKIRYYIPLTLIAMISAICLLIFTKSYLFIAFYMLLIFLFTVVEYYCSVLFSTLVSIERISSITSLRSSIGRIASICSMILSSLMLTKINVLFVVITNFIISFVLMLIILMIFLKIRTDSASNILK